MQTILIPTKPDDADSMFVAHALRHYGHNPVIWFPSDLPIQQYSSFILSSTSKTQWSVRGYHNEHVPQHIDTVWLRRPRAAILPDYIHKDDISTVKIENKRFFEMLWQSIAPTAFWVNDINAIKKTNSKLLQLEVAANVGFNIPATLVSNDPVEIKKFINSHPSVIYKPMRGHFWEEGDVIKVAYTNVVNNDKLPEDKILKLTPGIYQNKIEKAYEVRVTYFGTFAVAVSLNSQSHERGKYDWRSIPEGQMEINLIKLPQEIHDKCQALMRHFGLKMGCFDFIVTPDDEYYYLEVNEQGQFIWIEEYSKNIPILDIFTQFLIKNKYEFNYDETAQPVTLDQFRAAITDEMNINIKNHQNPPMC